MSVFSEIRTNMKKRAQYRATVRELESLDAAVARDLDIAPSDIRRIARQAVYG
ncbi:hypothetical protein [Mameliella sediminis]|uniref:hypothetical protein n=1 Tax=Mameliella sediminis TaxID=2836866 RepID=UPI001C44A15A|nr:hypothetical protein [Mameliella sediminis]MBY6114593.1 hypothetical protein [Antarctobacter heliothermus]MBY6144166.1 hypothetical protein [Mameliella alba]MBV7392926.1 hypothetical protein [Mameliella sediminis]MBY6161542.1 hypothetical protein [Mameliella alba]MBY6169992.1 hypothetical protein [Mameliella alba]